MNESQYGKGGERAPVSNLSAEELTNKWTPNAAAASTSSASSAKTANRSEAKERSQNHTASAGNSGISSKMEGYGTEKKYRGPDGGMYTAKEADNAGWTPGYYDEGAGGGEIGGQGRPKTS